METIDIVASGYEWICVKCEELNREIQVTPTVTCQECGEVFEPIEHHAS